MGIIGTNKTIDKTSISCDGTVKVTLSLTAAPDIANNPVDIMLVLDRSGSMSGQPLADLKLGAETFIDIIDEATNGGTPTGSIGGGTRIGIVGFDANATPNATLITSVPTLKLVVNQLMAGGGTNHSDAFEMATNLFDPLSTNRKVIIMFTDGVTTVGDDPQIAADAAKAQGITIYGIGLNGQGGIDEDALKSWVTAPSDTHLAITPDSAELEALFEQLAINISKAGATNIVITDTIFPDFNIVNLSTPTKGTVSQTGNFILKWEIDALGVTSTESAILEFTIKHTEQTTGNKSINFSIIYDDAENNMVTYPDPKVFVNCDDIVITEPCPISVDVTAEGCDDTISFDAGDFALNSLGRILQLDVNLKNICPNKRVALAVILTETDTTGQDQPRGLKTFTIPAHNGTSCKDVLVRCINFVLPEDLDVSGGDTETLCDTRNFKAKVLANYIDFGFSCCS